MGIYQGLTNITARRGSIVAFRSAKGRFCGAKADTVTLSYLLSEYKPDAQASASLLAYTRLRFGLVLVRNYLPLALRGRSQRWCAI